LWQKLLSLCTWSSGLHDGL